MPEIQNCRSGCGACCIAPSISTPIPGMPDGKPAGVRCVQLDDQQRCRIFGSPQRPAVCASLRPTAAMCGSDRAAAMQYLGWLETQTCPGPVFAPPDEAGTAPRFSVPVVAPGTQAGSG